MYRDKDLLVSHLIDETSKQWRTDILEALIDPGDIPLIRSLRPSYVGKEDGICWSFTKSGLYTVESGYELASHLKRKEYATGFRTEYELPQGYDMEVEDNPQDQALFMASSVRLSCNLQPACR